MPLIHAMPIRCATASVWLMCCTTMAPAADAADCPEARSTAETNTCLSRVFAEVDLELNAAYKAALKMVDASALQPNLAKDWRRALQEAQRKWIAYREADCGAPVAYEWTGGSATSGFQLGCRIARTRERLAVLKARYGQAQR